MLLGSKLRDATRGLIPGVDQVDLAKQVSTASATGETQCNEASYK